MDAAEQIRRFSEFLEGNYKNKILESGRKGKNYLVIEFPELLKFDPELADMLLEEPDEVIKAIEVASSEFDLPESVKNLKIRFSNLPDSQKIMIRNVRSKHLGKFLVMEGIVRQKSDVRPQVTAAKFECPSCGAIINVLQLEQKFKEPSRCGCGRKGKFRLISKELIDAQGMTLEEAPEDLEGGEQQKRLKVFLKDDLVSPITEKKTNPGSKILINGIIKEVPITGRDGGKLTRFDLLLEANYVEAVQEDYLDIEISEEEEKQIKELADDPKVYSKLINSVAPSMFGYKKIKEALLLQLVGGVRKVRQDGLITRGDMHVLLIGDPGAGKCVSGDTKILFENGEIATIKSLCEKNLSSRNIGGSIRKVFSINEEGRNFSSQPVRFWKRKAPKELLKIITNTGNELIVTREHPLFTTNNGLIFAKKADEYRVDEYIALPSKVDVHGSLQIIDDSIEKTKANNKVKYKIKKIFDSDFSRLFGYLIGYGYVRYSKTSGLISFTNNNFELLNDFENLVRKVFNLKVSKRKKQNSNSYEYYITSIELVRILEKIDPNITKKSENICINKTITKSPDNIVKEFIKSLFDCEGHVRRDRREIEFNSKSKELVFDLKYILLRFRIISQISSGLKCATNTKNKIKRKYYRLRISGENVIKYYKEIGFVSKEKQKKLEELIKNPRKLNTNLNIVPNLKALLRLLRKKYAISQFDFPISRSTYQHYEKGDRFPSYNKLKQICQRYINIKDPFIDILNQISKANIFWDNIKSIEKIKSDGDFVYDLEIERVHNFVANGVVIHNSQMLKRLAKVAPKARYVSGKGVSGAGLTASVVKDEFLGGWALEAGALPLCNRGFCMIDEMDKMSVEDTSAMHEALEGQTITISKANIQATLRAETTVLAAANPKFGRFDPYGLIAEQINMPPALINRFDLIFPVKDLPDEKHDEKLAKHVLLLHQNPDIAEPEIDTGFLRKYIAYIRQTCSPALTEGALEELKKYYVEMRGAGQEESGVKSVPISPRQLEALVRMAEAAAKIRLSSKVLKKDAKRAIDLLHYCLSQVGIDPATGKIDIDRIATGVSATQRSKILTVKEIIEELENRLGKTIPIDEIVKEAKEQGLEESDIEESIEKLKRSGDCFEPRRGFLSRI